MLCNLTGTILALPCIMRVCLTFYRTVAFPLICISMVCSYQVWLAQTAYFIVPVFWVKIITSLIIGTYIALFRSEQFIFFNNLGYSRTRALAYSFFFDFLIWLFIMGVTVKML